MRADVQIAGLPAHVVGEVRNLTLEGAGLALTQPVARGEVSLGLSLVDDDGTPQDPEPLWMSATVVWTAEVTAGCWAAGLRFHAIGAAQHERLVQLLSSVE